MDNYVESYVGMIDSTDMDNDIKEIFGSDELYLCDESQDQNLP